MISGDSGAGYVFPSALIDPKLRSLPEASDKWVEYNKKYFSRFDLDVVGFIINGVNTLTTDDMEMSNQFAPVAACTTTARKSSPSTRVCPIYICKMASTRLPPTRPGTMYSFMRANAAADVNFAAFRTVCNSPTQIAQCVKAFGEYANSKNSKYKFVYVDIYTLFDLIRQSGQGNILN